MANKIIQNEHRSSIDDHSGKVSSKRLWGTIFSVILAAMCIFLFVYSVFRRVGDPATALKIIEAMGMLIGWLFGIGVAENFKIGRQ